MFSLCVSWFIWPLWKSHTIMSTIHLTWVFDIFFCVMKYFSGITNKPCSFCCIITQFNHIRKEHSINSLLISTSIQTLDKTHKYHVNIKEIIWHLFLNTFFKAIYPVIRGLSWLWNSFLFGEGVTESASTCTWGKLHKKCEPRHYR